MALTGLTGGLAADEGTEITYSDIRKLVESAIHNGYQQL